MELPLPSTFAPVLGLAVGLISSLLGLGGGILLVPLLPLLFGLSQKAAIANSLFTIFCVVSVNVYFFNKKSMVNWSIALTVGLISAVFSFIAGQATFLVSESVLRQVLASLLLLFALRVVTPKKRGQGAKVEDGDSERMKNMMPNFYKKFFAGMGAGLMSGFSGVGSGLLLNTLMLHFRWVPHIFVAPTANGVIVFTTFFGGLSFYVSQLLGREGAGELVDGSMVLSLALGAWVSAYFGRKVQHRIPEAWRRGVLASILCVMSAQLWLRG